jgi:thymidine phosphorylase
VIESHDAVDVIKTKRDGHRLDDAQIDWVVDAYTRGVVADEQMAALAMAILVRGMDRRETARWTAAMIASGERMDFSSLSRPTSDKHSTGGVGDKITLPLAPLVAACGVAVPQLSGRGLGHTGGTLDKLEAIPGWRAELSNAEILAQLESVGAVICAAGSGWRRRTRSSTRCATSPERWRRSADRQLDHEQEDRRGHRRTRAGRQGRVGRVHEVAG